MNKRHVIIVLAVVVLVFGTLGMSAKAASPFKDVSENHGAYEDVMNLVNISVIQGLPNGTYEPNKPLTRLQGANIIGRALGINTNQPVNHVFSDVSPKIDAEGYVNALTNMGVFDKRENFNPNGNLTREQMAKILVITFELSGTANKSFNDVKKSDWSHDYIQTLYANGVTKGTSENTFSPGKTVTRVQMASFVSRTLNFPNEKWSPTFTMTRDILKYTNQERTKRGLKALKLDHEIQNVAMIKAKDMHINDYFDHESPVHGKPRDMLDKAKIEWKSVGENIAVGQQSAKNVVQAWMGSPDHRKNILNEEVEYTHIGVGYYLTDRGRPYYVQIFVRR